MGHLPTAVLANPYSNSPHTARGEAHSASVDETNGAHLAQCGEVNNRSGAPGPLLTPDDLDEDEDMRNQTEDVRERGTTRPDIDHGRDPARMIGGRRFPAKRMRGERRERAHLRLGTLNMNWRGATQFNQAGSKWSGINAIMRDRKISVLAVQETHLNDAHLADLEKLYSRLQILNSMHENATSTAGIAIVLNKDHIANLDETRYWEIIPGRAIVVRISWKEQYLFLLGIYGFNDYSSSSRMWSQIRTWLEENAAQVPRIDAMLGDMNFVEDEIDRAPIRLSDVDEARHEFKTLKDKLDVTDGWRHWNPGRLEWTWRRPNTFERSRIDRIYLSSTWLEESRDWSTEHALGCTDHYLVTTDITNHLCPEVGRGRWAMPNSVTDDPTFKALIKPLVVKLGEDVLKWRAEARNSETGVQILVDEFKAQAAQLARDRGKAVGSKAKKRIQDLDKLRRRTQNDASLDDKTKQTQVLDLEASIAEEQMKQSRQKSDQTRATSWVNADDSCKGFFAAGKPHRPKDTVKSLKTLDGEHPSWESNSPAMAGIAREFYSNLQTADTDVDENERVEAIDEALNHVNRHLTGDQNTELNSAMTRELVELALRESKNNSAPGINGLPYEFWKMLDNEFRKSKESAEPWPDIVQILTWCYVNIEEFGVDPHTSFTKGWLCPLFKKGNRDEIANYRPITLLNTDYKIYTKALAIKLASVAPDLIQDDQAGFMKGRSITDQCKLARLMVNWGETKCVNGAIVCLDQEKAYDRIRHDYLLLTLGAFNFPVRFVNTVRSLYEHAETEVILNGFKSKPFRVTRGVRQGDPLSCLLFNLAIEPLAKMIRKSRLRGFIIPGAAKRLIISLFADDTCVYLSENDDPAILHRMLNTWCLASGAKFNIKKTEVVPIGKLSFRNDVVESGRMKPHTAAFGEGAKIAAQGQAVRLLGAYIGNGVNQHGPWETIINQIDQILTSWNKRALTLTGKALVARSIVAGKTQYLGMVQGMPRDIQDRISEQVMNFIWPEGRRKAYISAEQLRAPVDEGGKALPDFHASEKSRQLVWLERMLRPKETRPLWAYLAEDLMKQDIRPNDGGGTIPMAARVNPFVQQWHPNQNKLCKDLQNLVDTAREVGIQINARIIPDQVKRDMPVWFHVGRKESDADQGNRTSQKDTAAKCLQTKHGILTAGQAADALRYWNMAEHRRQGRRDCECDECDRCRLLGCDSTRACYNKLTAVLDEIAPRWDPRVLNAANPLSLTEEELSANNDFWKAPLAAQTATPKTIAFNNSLEQSPAIADHFRIFTKSLRGTAFAGDGADMRKPCHPQIIPAQPPREELRVTVSTEITNPSADNAMCGVAAVFSSEDLVPIRVKLSDEHANPEEGTLTGILLALRAIDTTTPLRILTRNRQVIRRLTTDLEKHYNSGWSQVKRAQNLYRATADCLLSWQARVVFEDCKDSIEEIIGGLEAEEALLLPAHPGNVDAETSEFDIAGHQLRGITQNRALKLVKRTAKVPPRRGTFINTERTRCAIAEMNGRWPTRQELWKATRSKDIYKPTREFIWRMLHGTQKVGAFWFNIRNREMLSECPPCGATESMEHILLECGATAQTTVWREVKSLWQRTELPWPGVNMGAIMGCALVEIKDTSGKRLSGAARLYRILVSEAAFLIWKLRNERRIQNQDIVEKFHTESEIVSRWRASIERRLRIDAYWANTRKYKKKALDGQLLRETWKKVLHRPDGMATPNQWWAGPEFLVSIWPLRPRGRER